MATRNCIPFPADTKNALERFSNYLYARRGLATTTVDLDTGFIRRMAFDIGLEPSHEDIERYIADMRRRGSGYGNISNAIKAIEHYQDYRKDPIHLQRPVRPQKPDVAVLSEAKIAILIDSAKTLRQKTILAVLAYTGMRNAELIHVRIRNVDIAQQLITVERGKGGRGRICCVSGDCIEVLMDYLREARWYKCSDAARRERRIGQADDYLFVSLRRGNQLQTQDLRKIVRVAARDARIRKRVWPHLLRHSLATALLNRGASVYSIQALLGHAWVSTTLDYYLHPSRRGIQADYHRYVPSFV